MRVELDGVGDQHPGQQTSPIEAGPPSSGVLSAVEVTSGSMYAGEWAAALPSLCRSTVDEYFGLQPGARVLAVVAHPDDETFGFGATIADLAYRGLFVNVVALTSGQAALDHIGRSARGLAAQRRDEFAAACDALGVSDRAVLGLPDGHLRDHQEEVDSVVEQLVDDHCPDHLLTVWWGDPHPDHGAVGQATLRSGEEAGCAVSGFPIWAQHWSEPHSALREAQFQLMTTDIRAGRQRRLAIACYVSQTEPLADDLLPILPPSVVSWTAELAVRR